MNNPHFNVMGEWPISLMDRLYHIIIVKIQVKSNIEQKTPMKNKVHYDVKKNTMVQ